MSESEFTKQVIQLAQLRRWMAAHFRPARTAKGWRTPVQADGAGFPDLLLIRGDRIVVAELKIGNNKPTVEQQRWLEAFYTATEEAYVWWPGDWPEIEKVLE